MFARRQEVLGLQDALEAAGFVTWVQRLQGNRYQVLAQCVGL